MSNLKRQYEKDLKSQQTKVQDQMASEVNFIKHLDKT